MSKYRIKFGRWGEDITVQYLERLGYLIVDRNVRTPYGEIDVIAKDQDSLIFIEVKTRATSNFGMPEVSVTQLKQKHLLDAISYFFQEHPDLDCDWRIDVVAIRGKKTDATPEITHFKNAITDG